MPETDRVSRAMHSDRSQHYLVAELESHRIVSDIDSTVIETFPASEIYEARHSRQEVMINSRLLAFVKHRCFVPFP